MVRSLPLICLGVSAIAAPAAAQAPAETAATLLAQGRFDEAAARLDARLAKNPHDVQAQFLKGMLAAARGDQQLAIRLFRAILVDHPNAGRVRLELARAFFLAKDYGNAQRQFQFALSDNPPPAVVANVKPYLAAIRDARTLTYSAGIAIAPDSNLNTGSSAREVSLFGLPFDLSDEARKKSGVGLAIEAGGEWAPRIGKGKRLRVGFNGQRRDYSGADFDDMTIAAYAGPRIVSGRWDLSLLGTAYKRWFGGEPYNQARGARLEATYYASPRLALSGAFSGQRVTHRREAARNGGLLSLNLGAYRPLTPASAVTLKFGASRQATKAKAYSNWSGFAAAGYLRELPAGFSVYVEPSVSFARYDAALFGFEAPRRDTAKSVLVTLLNRRLVLSRFTPRVSYSYTRQSSSIPLFEFERSRFELGLTTVF